MADDQASRSNQIEALIAAARAERARALRRFLQVLMGKRSTTEAWPPSRKRAPGRSPAMRKARGQLRRAI